MFICIAYVHFDRIARDRRAIRSGSAAPYVVHVRWGGRVDFEVEAALPAATVRRVGTAEPEGSPVARYSLHSGREVVSERTTPRGAGGPARAISGRSAVLQVNVFNRTIMGIE